MSVIKHLNRLRETERASLLEGLDRATELPLLLLAFLMIPLVVGPFLWDLNAAEIALMSALNAIIWIAFAVDLGAKLILSTERVRYLREHWLDVVIVAIPFFRPFRIIRLFVYGSRAVQGGRRLSKPDFIIVYAFGSLIIATTFIVSFERSSDSQLADFPNALWWGVVTITTVGYGDITPATVGGKIVAAFLMVVGIGMFSFLTANIASRFVTQDEHEANGVEVSKLAVEIRSLRDEVGLLRSSLKESD